LARAAAAYPQLRRRSYRATVAANEIPVHVDKTQEASDPGVVFIIKHMTVGAVQVAVNETDNGLINDRSHVVKP
jgi:hypothetical protein